MTTPVVETFGLSKQYQVGPQTVNALTDLSIRIDPGEFVAIMGPSGSGKSTCMYLLGCLQAPSSGSYRFNGIDVTALGHNALADIRNTQLGFVFQSFHLQPRASALRNVELPLVYARCPRRQRRARAEAALRAVGLAERMVHRPAQLSGGEMQRVAIARALVNKPRLLLTDEPTGALDSRTSTEIMSLLSALNEDGITIVLVTHDEEIAAQAKRLLRFRDGALISDEASP